MASPVIVTSSAGLIIGYNENRNHVRFQNTGSWPVALAKQIPGAAPNVPSETNFDVLLDKAGEETDTFVTNSIAAFAAVVISPGASDKTSEVAIIEAVNIPSTPLLGGCCGR